MIDKCFKLFFIFFLKLKGKFALDKYSTSFLLFSKTLTILVLFVGLICNVGKIISAFLFFSWKPIILSM